MPDPVSIHEAAHAAVALHLGLSVREVRVTGETEVPRYCETLYGIKAGLVIPGACTLLEEDCLDTDAGSVLIAMVAPSCIETGEAAMDYYAVIETGLALGYAEKVGLDPNWILDRAHQEALLCEQQILDLAERLDAEGVVYSVASS